MMIQVIKSLYALLYRKASKIHKNVGWLIGLNIVMVLNQFIIYTFINKHLGKEYLGIWSLVVAATSIGQISSFGFSNSLVRYLPEMLLKNEKGQIEKVIGTINSSNFFLTLPILLVLYFPAIQYATHLLTPSQLIIFKSVIPVSMAALFVNNLFLAYSYLLDAMQKYYLRSIIQIAGCVLFLILSLLLMPGYGLKGVAISFLLQNIFQFILIIIVVSRKGLLGEIYPLYFDKSFFKQASSFGLKSQYINVLVIFFDPLVKFFITKNIGLVYTANYEVSNKIVLQARNLLVNTNQVIIPKVVLHQNAGTENDYFNSISKRNTLFSISVGMIMLLFAPLAVFIFARHYDSNLMQCIIILNIGWVCNMITSVHYYCCIGLDKMGELVLYHLILSLVTILLYIFLNNYFRINNLYNAVPAAALLIGSIYNSYSLSKRINGTFLWLRSGIFLYFIFVSVVLLMIHYTNIATLTYWIMPLLFLGYLTWIARQDRVNELLKLNTINEKD